MANKFSFAGPDSKYKQPDAKPAGFWAGYWHGLIAPIAFAISLFNKNVSIYETQNNGKWYDFGFVLGASSTMHSSVNISAKPKQQQTLPAPPLPDD